MTTAATEAELKTLQASCDEMRDQRAEGKLSPAKARKYLKALKRLKQLKESDARSKAFMRTWNDPSAWDNANGAI